MSRSKRHLGIMSRRTSGSDDVDGTVGHRLGERQGLYRINCEHKEVVSCSESGFGFDRDGEDLDVTDDEPSLAISHCDDIHPIAGENSPACGSRPLDWNAHGAEPVRRSGLRQSGTIEDPAFWHSPSDHPAHVTGKPILGHERRESLEVS